MKAYMVNETLEVRLETGHEVDMLFKNEELVTPIRFEKNAGLKCDLSLKFGGSISKDNYVEGMFLFPQNIPFKDLDKAYLVVDSNIMSFLKDPLMYSCRKFWGSQRSVNRRIEIYAPLYCGE